MHQIFGMRQSIIEWIHFIDTVVEVDTESQIVLIFIISIEIDVIDL